MRYFFGEIMCESLMFLLSVQYTFRHIFSVIKSTNVFRYKYVFLRIIKKYMFQDKTQRKYVEKNSLFHEPSQNDQMSYQIKGWGYKTSILKKSVCYIVVAEHWIFKFLCLSP